MYTRSNFLKFCEIFRNFRKFLPWMLDFFQKLFFINSCVIIDDWFWASYYSRTILYSAKQTNWNLLD